MKKYVINISGTSNISDNETFFMGTGFMGAGFDTVEELKTLLHKYATYEKDGNRYWRPEIRLTFELGETMEAFKNEGDRQCAEYGFVNLFKAAMVAENDPFYKISIIYRPGRWIDKNGNTFAFVLINDEEVIPKYNMKLTDILREIGMDI